MRLAVVIALVLAVLVAAFAPRGEAAVSVRPPVDDVGFPFWCDWSYDWEARCYRDSGPRLPVGGVDDKVWRSGLRFSLAGIPPGAVVASARLELKFEGDCVAPALGVTGCSGEAVQIAAYPIASADWYHEREPDYYWTVEDVVEVDPSQGPDVYALNLTALTREWVAGRIANNGVLLKLTDASEDFEVGGPYFASMNAAEPSVRPRLVIVYSSPTGTAR
jgi:hypothetical protein